MKVKVDRNRVPEAASYLLQRGAIADLLIEEVSVSEIIETLLLEGAHGNP